ncbi:MAG: hypothetical protein ACXVB9_17235 [Bdellovibrionota bacterium]
MRLAALKLKHEKPTLYRAPGDSAELRWAGTMKRAAIIFFSMFTAMIVLAEADSLTREPLIERGPAATATETDFHPRLEGFSAQLEETAQCLTRTDCNFPQAEYVQSVNQELRAEIQDLNAWAKANHIRSFAVTAVALPYLKIGGGSVRAAALEVLAGQPTSPESLEAILTDVVSGQDASVVSQALQELARYQNGGDRARIAEALSGAMLSGPPFMAKEISAGIAPFLDEQDFTLFSDAASALPEAALVRINLEAALKDYRGGR